MTMWAETTDGRRLRIDPAPPHPGVVVVELVSGEPRPGDSPGELVLDVEARFELAPNTARLLAGSLREASKLRMGGGI